jgi:hypothetical protein
MIALNTLSGLDFCSISPFVAEFVNEAVGVTKGFGEKASDATNALDGSVHMRSLIIRCQETYLPLNHPK